MELKKVNIKEFKKIIYPEYKRIFPKVERRRYPEIKKPYNKNITSIIEIISDNQFIGFAITNSLKDNSYIYLDYFAILPEYQHKGYGTEAIKLLKEYYKDFDGIFIEIEKVGNADNNEENRLREKRAKFYENLGFCKMNFNLKLFTVTYSAYVLPCKGEKLCDSDAINNIFNIYNAIYGEDKAKRNCKVI